MTDDIVTRLRNDFAKHDYPMLKDHCESCAIPKEFGGHHRDCLYDEAADEIERLRQENTKLRGTVLDIHKTGQELWSMVSCSRDSYADEVMYLRKENNKASALIAKLAKLLLPYSRLMNKHEQELLIQAVRGD